MELPAQRALGRLSLEFQHAGGQTRPRRLYQLGCLKVLLPRPAEADSAEAVSLNISGGIAGGDTLATDIVLDDNARLIMASQAAERIYRAVAEPARIGTSLVIGAGARLDYLPQETILFDGFGLERSLRIDMDETSQFLGVESLVFGRAAMGETIHRGWLRDSVTLCRNGRLVLQDATRLDGDIAAILARQAVAGGAAALATLIYAAPHAAEVLPGLRAALAPFGAASAVAGLVFARILAPDAYSLRSCLRAALGVCRDGRPLPKVWQ